MNDCVCIPGAIGGLAVGPSDRFYTITFTAREPWYQIPYGERIAERSGELNDVLASSIRQLADMWMTRSDHEADMAQLMRFQRKR
jgi:hypothetical protein